MTKKKSTVANRYLLYVVEEVGQDQRLVFLGGCKSPQHATVLVNTSYANHKINNPKQILLVPSRFVFQCKQIQTFELEALVDPIHESSTASIVDLTAPGQVIPTQA